MSDPDETTPLPSVETGSGHVRTTGSTGQGRHRVWFERHSQLHDDLVYIVGGGDRSHVGCVVLKVPGEESKVVTRGTHKEHHILVPIAEVASERYGVTVVVTGGVHIDDASPEDITLIVKNCENLHSML
jgi:gallate decarboxylase subunit D